MWRTSNGTSIYPMHISEMKVFTGEVTLGLKASEGGCWHISGRAATFG